MKKKKKERGCFSPLALEISVHCIGKQDWRRAAVRGFRAPTVTHLAGSRAALGKMMHSRVGDQACASRPRLLTWALAFFHHYYCICVFTQGGARKGS